MQRKTAIHRALISLLIISLFCFFPAINAQADGLPGPRVVQGIDGGNSRAGVSTSTSVSCESITLVIDRAVMPSHFPDGLLATLMEKTDIGSPLGAMDINRLFELRLRNETLAGRLWDELLAAKGLNIPLLRVSFWVWMGAVASVLKDFGSTTLPIKLRFERFPENVVNYLLEPTNSCSVALITGWSNWRSNPRLIGTPYGRVFDGGLRTIDESSEGAKIVLAVPSDSGQRFFSGSKVEVWPSPHSGRPVMVRQVSASDISFILGRLQSTFPLFQYSKYGNPASVFLSRSLGIAGLPPVSYYRECPYRFLPSSVPLKFGGIFDSFTQTSRLDGRDGELFQYGRCLAVGTLVSFVEDSVSISAHTFFSSKGLGSTMPPSFIVYATGTMDSSNMQQLVYNWKQKVVPPKNIKDPVYVVRDLLGMHKIGTLPQRWPLEWIQHGNNCSGFVSPFSGCVRQNLNPFATPEDVEVFVPRLPPRR